MNQLFWDKIRRGGQGSQNGIIAYIEDLVALKHEVQAKGICGFDRVLSEKASAFEQFATRMIVNGFPPTLCAEVLLNVLNSSTFTDKEYFNRIEALEFAVTYDDGKDPAGFLKADLVLLGISRTSKTPLSLFLANRGYKVANLPLVPKAQIPAEIYKVDPNKIFGLTNDPEILNGIRRERMISYGLDPDTHYSNIDNIESELNFANELYKKLGCPVINVAHKSIEETAMIITESLDNNAQR